MITIKTVFKIVDFELPRYHKILWPPSSFPTVMGELTCDSCDCRPNVIYTTSKGRFCENCKPAS